MSEIINRRNFLKQSAGTALAGVIAGTTIQALAAPPAKTPYKTKLKKALILHCFPGSLPVADRFKMAADTEGAEPQPSRVESLWDGAVELSLYPGFHAGSIKITVQEIRI